MDIRTREPRTRKRGGPADGYDGFLGFLIGSAGAGLAMIALAVMGSDVPAWAALVGIITDRSADAARNAFIGPFLLLMAAWLGPALAVAFAAASLVLWIAGRFVRREYGPAYLIAEVAAVAVTLLFFVILGLAADNWSQVAAWMIIGLLALLLVHRVARRLHRTIARR
jgi:hypothetical protein